MQNANIYNPFSPIFIAHILLSCAAALKHPMENTSLTSIVNRAAGPLHTHTLTHTHTHTHARRQARTQARTHTHTHTHRHTDMHACPRTLNGYNHPVISRLRSVCYTTGHGSSRR